MYISTVIEKRLIRQKSSQDILRRVKTRVFRKELVNEQLTQKEIFSYNKQLNRFHLQIIVSVTIDLYGRQRTTCTYSKAR